MNTESDRPLIELVDYPGCPYPLPPGFKLRSFDPTSSIMKLDRFDVVQWPQRLLDGVTTKIFQTIARRPAVILMPVNSEGQVMLVKTQQPGRPPYEGFVAGDMDASDPNPFATAERELLEETGYVAEAFHLVYFHFFVAGWEWFAYTIVAEKCVKDCEPIQDNGEKSEPYFVSVDTLIQMSREEKFIYPPVLVNKLLLRQEEGKLHRLFKNPSAFAARTYTLQK